MRRTIEATREIVRVASSFARLDVSSVRSTSNSEARHRKPLYECPLRPKSGHSLSSQRDPSLSSRIPRRDEVPMLLVPNASSRNRRLRRPAHLQRKTGCGDGRTCHDEMRHGANYRANHPSSQHEDFRPSRPFGHHSSRPYGHPCGRARRRQMRALTILPKRSETDACDPPELNTAQPHNIGRCHDRCIEPKLCMLQPKMSQTMSQYSIYD